MLGLRWAPVVESGGVCRAVGAPEGCGVLGRQGLRVRRVWSHRGSGGSRGECRYVIAVVGDGALTDGTCCGDRGCGVLQDVGHRTRRVRGGAGRDMKVAGFVAA